MNGKGLAALSVIILFFAIIFGGAYLFNAMLPSPKTSEFYSDGVYSKYKMQCEGGFGEGIKKGYLVFNVDVHKLFINITVYSDSKILLYREITLNVSDDGNTVYYKGRRIILPFFHGQGDIISYYNKSYVNATDREGPILSPFSKIGITKYREVFIYETYNYILGNNGSVVNRGVLGRYEYGAFSSLLFYMISFGYDPFFYHIANLTYNGIHCIVSLLLIDTNIQLAPPNYLGVIAMYTILMSPVLLILAIPAIAIYIYKYMKRRKERNEREKE